MMIGVGGNSTEHTSPFPPLFPCCRAVGLVLGRTGDLVNRLASDVLLVQGSVTTSAAQVCEHECSYLQATDDDSILSVSADGSRK